MSSKAVLFAVAVISSTIVAFACGSSTSRDQFGDDGSSSGASGTSGTSGFGGDGSSGSSGSGDDGRDPTTCAEAESSKSYVGCDYWPTVTANNVWSLFDYAVVVSNISMTDANVTVTGPSSTNQMVTVKSGTLEKIFLKWETNLKGPDSPSSGPTTGQATPMPASAKGQAYHLVSTVPVVVYQFNPLEYAGKGGPSGKSWNNCPKPQGAMGCFSYSNDASLLLPSTAWTGNYRVTGIHGWSSPGFPPIVPGQDVMGGYFTVTASQDGTNVTVALGAKAQILAGGGLSATNGGGKVTFSLNAGDAVELVTPIGDKYDVSGSQVQADKPVQVLTGIPCIYVPETSMGACDHVEESVLPAEALGKKYLVATPTSPAGSNGQHLVRFYGNRDGTTLTYQPSAPSGCPTTLSAGQVVDCGDTVGSDFYVEGNNEFGVSTFMVSATVYDPTGTDPRGDPSQSVFGSVEQARTSYLFLAPDDYDVNYAVVTGPSGAAPTIDGSSLGGYKDVGGGFGVWRATLDNKSGGSHKLASTLPVGLQVMGYGSYTSYQYPGGLNLKAIAAPPPPIK